MPAVVVTSHDPAWPAIFAAIRDRIAPALEGVAIRIEHVGSTAVPGLAAKPIIDIDVVVPGDAAFVAKAIERLAGLGYVHRGDLGIEGREAFSRPEGSPPHHLYVVREDSLPLRNHLALRDYLRANPSAAQRYGALKLELAARYANDVDSYVRAKTALVIELLRAAGVPEAALAVIREQNL